MYMQYALAQSLLTGSEKKKKHTKDMETVRNIKQIKIKIMKPTKKRGKKGEQHIQKSFTFSSNNRFAHT